MSRGSVHLVRDPATWRVVIAPVRTEILETLRLIGPCSIAEIGAVIDRPADTLYRHIAALQKAGFVRDAGYRKSGRHAEQLVDVVAEDFIIDFAGGEDLVAENQAIYHTAASFLGAMERTVRDTAAINGLDPREATRNISINYELSWLTPEKFREVRALIRQIKKLMDEGKRSREGTLVSTLAIACPVTRKRGAKGRSAKKNRPEAAPRASRGRPSSGR